ncbi:MAG: ParB N-terminal domain-containing protein [Clostridia bacterium]|nr:ParB N-terminal domain-containing protein [Clostridia bacterium]
MSIGKNSLARAAAATASRPVAGGESKAPAQFRQVEIGAILPLKGKAHKATADEALTVSVAKYGVLEPLLLAQTGAEELRVIAGSRRLDAARQAGLATVPAIILDMTVAQATEAKKELDRFTAVPADAPGTVEATAVGQAMPAWLL